MKLGINFRHLGWLAVCTLSLLTPLMGETAVRTVALEENRLCSEIVEYRGAAYFCYSNQQFGRELHRSDGTQFGTKIVINLFEGGFNSLGGLFVFQDKLFFFTKSSNEGGFLWESDGTEQGTKVVKRIPIENSFYSGSAVTKIGEIAGTLFFYFRDSLYRTNGSANGTARITSVQTNATTFKVHENHLYFLSSEDNILRKVDVNGNLQSIKHFDAYDAHIHEDSLDQKVMIEVRAFTPDPTDPPIKTIDEYWLSDGTASGTVMALRRSHIIPLRVIDGKLLYLDIFNPHAGKLMSTENWSSSSLITSLVISIAPRVETRKVGGKIFFTTNYSTQYVTDGTAVGTQKTTLNPFNYTELNGDLISDVPIDGSVYSRKLRKFEVSSTVKTDIYDFGKIIELRDLTTAGEKAFFWFHDNLWVTSGTNSSTNLVSVHSGLLEPLGNMGSSLFYAAQTPPNTMGNEFHRNYMWFSNGFTEGTQILMYSYDDDDGDEVSQSLNDVMLRNNITPFNHQTESSYPNSIISIRELTYSPLRVDSKTKLTQFFQLSRIDLADANTFNYSIRSVQAPFPELFTGTAELSNRSMYNRVTFLERVLINGSPEAIVSNTHLDEFSIEELTLDKGDYFISVYATNGSAYETVFNLETDTEPVLAENGAGTFIMSSGALAYTAAYGVPIDDSICYSVKVDNGNYVTFCL